MSLQTFSTKNKCVTKPYCIIELIIVGITRFERNVGYMIYYKLLCEIFLVAISSILEQKVKVKSLL